MIIHSHKKVNISAPEVKPTKVEAPKKVERPALKTAQVRPAAVRVEEKKVEEKEDNKIIGEDL